MLKTMLTAAAAISLIGLGACTQGPNEEAGEAADTAYEQSTTGATDLGQGPMEEAGEQMDEAADEAGDAVEDMNDAAEDATTP